MSSLIGLVMFAYYKKYAMSPQQEQAAPDQVRGSLWLHPVLMRSQYGSLSRVPVWLNWKKEMTIFFHPEVPAV